MMRARQKIEGYEAWPRPTQLRGKDGGEMRWRGERLPAECLGSVQVCHILVCRWPGPDAQPWFGVVQCSPALIYSQ